MDLLLHEVPVVALFHERGRGRDDGLRATNGAAVSVEDAGAVVGDGDPVALLEIADPVGEGSDGKRVAP